MTNWVYVAVDTICCKVAAISPNLAYVSTEERPGVTEKAGYRSLHASSKYLVGRYGGTAFLEDYPVGQGRAYDLQRVLPFPRGLSGHTIGFSEGGHSWLTMGAYRSKALSVVKPHEELEPLEHDHPLRRLIDNPNPYDTAFDLEYELQMFEELTGVSFEWLVPNRFGMPCERWCLPSHWVWPRTGGGRSVDPNDPDAHRLIWYYEVRPWGGAYGMSGVLHIPADEIVMTRWKSPLDKIGGHAKTAAIAQWIDSEESVGRSRWAQFMNVARPEFWVQLGPGYEDPDDDRIARIEAKFASKFQGEYNYGKPIITPPGSVLTPLSFNPTEMAYMGSEEQLRDMILSAWRVPPAAVGIVKEMTYGSILATLGSLCSFCINPRLAMRGQVRTKHLASRWDEPDGPAWSQGYSLTEEGKAVQDTVVKTGGYGGRGVGRRVRLWYDDCLDPETECLTDRGWKRQEELTAETRIACYDDETDTIVYRRPRRIIRRHHDGVLHVWEGGRVNAAMTPRHRVYVQSRPKTNRPVPVWGFRLAGDLQGSSLDYRVRRAAPAACDAPAAVPIDRYVGWHQRGLGEVDSIDPRLWLEFLGYYLSEGNLERNKGPDKGAWLITIAQGEDNANFRKMAECIGAMPFGDWKTYRKRHKRYGDKYIQFVCTDRGLYEHLLAHCGNGSALKRVPNYVKSWPAADLRVLLDALIAGDGRRPYTTASTGVWNSQYTTVSSQLADDVMEIAVKCGIAASITRHEPAKPHQSPYYVVNLSSRIIVSVLPTRRRVVPYSGLVWCVEIPTGKFVVRRGGMAHITGNCVPADPDQVNSDIQVDLAGNAITPNEIRALRGRKGYRKGGDDPIVQGPGGPMPLPLNTGEAADLEGLAELIAPMTQAGKGEGEQGGGPVGSLGQGPGAEPLPEETAGQLPGEEGGENATGLEPPEEPNGPPGKGWSVRKAAGKYAEGTSPEYDADPTLVQLGKDFLSGQFQGQELDRQLAELDGGRKALEAAQAKTVLDRLAEVERKLSIPLPVSDSAGPAITEAVKGLAAAVAGQQPSIVNVAAPLPPAAPVQPPAIPAVREVETVVERDVRGLIVKAVRREVVAPPSSEQEAKP